MDNLANTMAVMVPPPAMAAQAVTDLSALQAQYVMSALKRFRVVFRAVKRHFMEVERQCGIGGAQLWALSNIVSQPGIRVTELARQLAIHQSTASNLVEELVRAGLIERRRGSDDRRVVSLFSTSAGLDLVASVRGPHEGLLPEALGRLETHTLTTLDGCLAELVKAMDGFDVNAETKPLAVTMMQAEQ